MIIPDPPNQAMKSVELNLDRLNITNVDMGCQVIRRLGQYKVGENNQLEEIEEGELASRVYNLYEFTVDDYNEWAKDEIVDFRPVLAFRGIRFIMRDLSQSILNDNFKFIKRPLGGTETIVDLSDFDKEYNVLANDSPWSTWLKVRDEQNISVNSNTISVDVQTAPNELDQDLVYDSFQPPATRDVNQVTEYFPQNYIIENNKVVREQAGISGYNLDLDIMCLRSITVQPAQYPYTFSIADYNTQNNTNYVGVRKVVVEGSSSNITQISNYPITQNGTQIVPIPTGYDAVDSISLNVNVSSLPLAAYYLKDVVNSQIYPFNQFTKITYLNKTFINESSSYYKYYLFIVHGSTTWKVTRYRVNKNTSVTLSQTPTIDVYYFSIGTSENSAMKIMCDINGVDKEYMTWRTSYDTLSNSAIFSVSSTETHFNDDVVYPDFNHN